MSRRLAPTAKRTPISCRRSCTASSIMFITPMPPTARVVAARMNSTFMNEQAALLAQRAAEEAGDDLEERVGHALRIVLSRSPEPDEVTAGVDLVQELTREEGFDAIAACVGPLSDGAPT